jgi:hypothetical protein
MSEGQLKSLLVQAAQGAMMVGGLYAGAAVLCEVNSIDDMRTVVMASSAETPILLMGAAFLGYGLRTYGPPLVAVPSAHRPL